MKNNLKEFREDAGLTLSQLGGRCGISTGRVRQLEREDANPTLRTAYLISSILTGSVYDIWPDTTEIIEETVTIRRCVIK